MRRRHIYFLAAKFAYNDIQRGLSYEYQTIYKSLCEALTPGQATCEFIDPYQKFEPAAFIKKLKADAEAGVDLTIIYCPYTGLISPELFSSWGQYATLGLFFLDDTWRTDFVASYVGFCDWFTTSDPHYQHRYKNVTGSKPVYFPFGYDATLATRHYKPLNQRDIAVSFLGAKDAFRSYAVTYLKSKGVDVTCYGAGWENGTIDNEKFYEILGRSRISLNLSNSSCWDLRFLLQHPSYMLRNLRTNKVIEQFKARHLEIAAMGACQVSYYTQGLETILPIGTGVVVYPSIYEIPDIIERLSQDGIADVTKKTQKLVETYSYQGQFQRLLS